jgi:hypothetical protein
MRMPGFAGGSTQALSPLASGAITFNLYAEDVIDPASEVSRVLYSMPGYRVFSQFGAGGGRALFKQNDRAWTVMGAVFYEVDLGTGVLTLRGAVAVNANPAVICGDGDGGGALFVSSGNNGYHYDTTTNVFTLVLTGEVTTVAFLDGSFYALDAATSTVRRSDLFDGLTWDALEYFQRTLASDRWIAMVATNREMWLIGTETSEVWVNDEDRFVPQQTVIPFGAAGSFGITLADGAPVWVARTAQGEGRVVLAVGLAPRRISTHAIETTLAGYVTLEDAQAASREWNGHVLVYFTFPKANKSWCYDLATDLWYELGDWNVPEVQYDAVRDLWHIHARGKHLAVDRTVGKIWELRADMATGPDGTGIRRVRRCPAITHEGRRLVHQRLELLLEPGLAAQNVAEPQIELLFSDNGGKTWKSAGFCGAGTTGEYGTRVFWGRLGSTSKRVYELVMWSAERLIDCTLWVGDGTERK